MATSKPKLITAAILGLILLAVVGVIGWNVLSGSGHSTRQMHVDPAAAFDKPQPLQSPPAAVSAKPESEWLPKFKSVYALADGEMIKRVPRPFIPERQQFLLARVDQAFIKMNPQGPAAVLFDDDGRRPQIRIVWLMGANLGGLARAILMVDEQKLIGPSAVLNKELTDDIVIRSDLDRVQNCQAIAALLSELSHRRLNLELRDLQRPVLVVSGELSYRGPATTRATAPPDTMPSPFSSVTIRPKAPRVILALRQPRGEPNTTTGKSEDFFRRLEDVCQMPVVADDNLLGKRFSWQVDPSAYNIRSRDGRIDSAKIDALLAGISEQSLLTFRREERAVQTWVLSEDGPASLPATTAPLR